nr:radical SAM protein [Candidatus Sigynarchaeota archaeon]
MVTYTVKQYKGIVNKLKYIDSWFWCRYTINPYNGCEHDCIYCDGRSRKYNMHDDFEDTIYVKQGAAAMLDDRIRRSRSMLPDVTTMGGVCDAYQAGEKDYKVTLEILEVLLKHGFPVYLLTKSDLITRDIDVISAINQTAWAAVSFTITTTDPAVARVLEPRASTPSKRLAALKAFKDAHPEIQAGIAYMPIVPFLEDSDESIDQVLGSVKDAGGTFVLFAPGMSLREGQQEYFLARLKAAYPREHDLLVQQFINDESFRKQYITEMNKKLLAACNKLGLDHRMQRYIPNDYRKINYMIAEYLLNKSYDLQITGGAWKSSFWTGQNIQNLKESIVDMNARGELHSIRGMTKAMEAEITPFFPKRSSLDQFLDA